MHELAVTESILEIATRYGHEADAARITDVFDVKAAQETIIEPSLED